MPAGRRPGAKDEPLTVDGTRPSVAWVSTLPESWTKSPQRLVLLALACDAFTDVSRAPVGKLASWCGLSRSRAFELLTELCRPVPNVRPALLERVNGRGQAIPEGSHWGGVVGYRLRWEASEGSDGSTEPNPSETPDGSGPEPSEQPSEQPSEASDTPYPSLPSTSSPRSPSPDDDGLSLDGIAERIHEARRGWHLDGVRAEVRSLLANGWTSTDVLTAGIVAAADASIQTPAGIRYRKPEPGQAGADTGPWCVCGRTRAGHDKAELKVPADQRHDFEERA